MRNILTTKDVDALRAIAEDIRLNAEDSSYGFAVPDDPRDFTPDMECCSDEEVALHKLHCEMAERGEAVTVPVGCGHAHGYGVGVSTWQDSGLLALAQSLDDWIDAAGQMGI